MNRDTLMRMGAGWRFRLFHKVVFGIVALRTISHAQPAHSIKIAAFFIPGGAGGRSAAFPARRQVLEDRCKSPWANRPTMRARPL